MDTTTDDVMAGLAKVATALVSWLLSAWIASMVWNAWLAPALGVDYFMTFSTAVFASLFLRFLVK